MSAPAIITYDVSDPDRFADDDYAPLKAIRHESTTNSREYIAPGMG